MKDRFKKISLILALSLILTSVPGSVFAEPVSDVQEEETNATVMATEASEDEDDADTASTETPEEEADTSSTETSKETGEQQLSEEVKGTEKEPESKTEEDTKKEDDAVADEKKSDDTVSDDRPEETTSENGAEEETVSENTLSENQVSENAVSEKDKFTLSDKTKKHLSSAVACVFANGNMNIYNGEVNNETLEAAYLLSKGLLLSKKEIKALSANKIYLKSNYRPCH